LLCVVNKKKHFIVKEHYTLSVIMSKQLMDPTALAAISSAAVLVGAYLFTSTSSAPEGKNPFETDSREPSKPFESDKRKRDDVLKNGYTAKKYEETLKDGKDYDAIIIGSGMCCDIRLLFLHQGIQVSCLMIYFSFAAGAFVGIGSLVTAAIMARAGKKVLVLEQHDQAGGCE
jgi:all-trans-retinol 13,14-reductase